MPFFDLCQMDDFPVTLFCISWDHLHNQHYNTMLECSNSFEPSDICMGSFIPYAVAPDSTLYPTSLGHFQLLEALFWFSFYTHTQIKLNKP